MDGSEEVCKRFICVFALGIGRAVRVYLILLKYHLMPNNSDMGEKAMGQKVPYTFGKTPYNFIM